MKAMVALLAVLLMSGCLFFCDRQSTSLQWEQEWAGRVAQGSHAGWTTPTHTSDPTWALPLSPSLANGRSEGDGFLLEEVSWRPSGAERLSTPFDAPDSDWYSLAAVSTNDPDTPPDAPLVEVYWLQAPRDNTSETRADFDRFAGMVLGGDRDLDALWQDHLDATFYLELEPPFTLAVAWNDAVPDDVPLRENPAVTPHDLRRHAHSDDWYVKIDAEHNRLTHDGYDVALEWDAWGRAKATVDAEDGWPSKKQMTAWMEEAFEAVGQPVPDLSDAEFFQHSICPD